MEIEFRKKLGKVMGAVTHAGFPLIAYEQTFRSNTELHFDREAWGGNEPTRVAKVVVSLADSALVQIRYGDDETECVIWGVELDGFTGFVEPDQVPYEAVVVIHRPEDADFDSLDRAGEVDGQEDVCGLSSRDALRLD